MFPLFAHVPAYPFVFVLNDFGNHPITKPLKSLDGLMAPMLSIRTKTAKDVTVFKSLGLGVEDIALAVRVVELARQQGLGKEIL